MGNEARGTPESACRQGGGNYGERKREAADKALVSSFRPPIIGERRKRKKEEEGFEKGDGIGESGKGIVIDKVV